MVTEKANYILLIYFVYRNIFSLERKKNEQTKRLITIYGCFCYTIQLITINTSFVSNFRILSQVVAVKSFTEKGLQTYKQTNRQT